MKNWSKGDRVAQPTYGAGTLVEVNEHHTVIDFDEHGRKVFATRLVTLQASNEPAPPEPPKTAAEQLRCTPTLIVPPATLAQFAATDFPLLIATDSKGIIRFIQPASETALNQGDFLDQITMHIATQWPRQAPPAATAPSTPTKP